MRPPPVLPSEQGKSVSGVLETSEARVARQKKRMAARVIPGKGLHSGFGRDVLTPVRNRVVSVSDADSREQITGRQFQPPVLNPMSGALWQG